MARSGMPWYKRFPGDWLNEPAVRRLSLAARGAWCDLIDLMYLEGTDRVQGTPTELARMLGCTTDEARSVVVELARAGTCDVTPDVTHVTLSDGIVTLKSRRRARELKGRVQTRLRVRAHRAKKACNAPVTGQKSEVRSQKSDKSPPYPPKAGGGEPLLPGLEVGNGSPPKAPPWKPRHDYVSEWNALAKKIRVPVIKALTPSRKGHLRSREKNGEAWDWHGVLRQLASSTKWVTGFRAFSFDWLVKNDENWAKVLEGKYAERDAAGNPTHRRHQLDHDDSAYDGWLNKGEEGEQR